MTRIPSVKSTCAQMVLLQLRKRDLQTAKKAGDDGALEFTLGAGSPVGTCFPSWLENTCM